RPRALREDVPNLQIGMVGLGRFVNNNVLPAYRARGYQVVAAADPDPAARERVARCFGIDRLYADYREMLDAARLDIVGLNLRWDRGMSAQRVEAATEAASRGVHVHVAKPLAETYAHAVAIVKAARDGGVKLAVNQKSRYARTFFAAGELIRRGGVGPLVGVGRL